MPTVASKTSSRGLFFGALLSLSSSMRNRLATGCSSNNRTKSSTTQTWAIVFWWTNVLFGVKDLHVYVLGKYAYICRLWVERMYLWTNSGFCAGAGWEWNLLLHTALTIVNNRKGSNDRSNNKLPETHYRSHIPTLSSGQRTSFVAMHRNSRRGKLLWS